MTVIFPEERHRARVMAEAAAPHTCRMGRGRIALGALVMLGGCVGTIAPAGHDSQGHGMVRGADPEAGLLPSIADAPWTVGDGVGSSGLRRLSTFEYDNTLRDILGDDTRPAAAALPQDRTTPFDNDFQLREISRPVVEGIETLALEATGRLLKDRPRLARVLGCTPASASDTGCLRRFIDHFGRLVVRQPLPGARIDELMAVAMPFATAAGSFDAAVEVVMRALLQDPAFIYRVEGGAPVPRQPGLFRLDGYALATRMSYLIWGSTPDGALLDRAGAGGLDRPDDRTAVVLGMLADARARVQLDRFFALWLGYDRLPHPAELTIAMRVETAALVSKVILEQHEAWTELFLAGESYVGDALAAHYGMTPPGSATPVWMDVARWGRAGLLSQGAFLSVAANVADTSPTKRGKLVREQLLCQTVPPPSDPNVADKPPAATLSKCKWDRYQAHRQVAACRACHELMDPIGFGLENYDKAGRYRDHDTDTDQASPTFGKPIGACPISGNGSIAGAGTFHGPAELGRLVAGSQSLPGCAARKLYQYAMGHAVAADDRAFVDTLGARLEGTGFFHRLIVDLVAHPAFAYRREEALP